jgi:hypothetical protein
MNKNNIFSLLLLFVLAFMSCKKYDSNNVAKESITNKTQIIKKNKTLKDTIINSINLKRLSNIKNENKEKIVHLYLNSFKKDGIEPNIALDQIKNNCNIITVKKYIDLNINNNPYTVFFLSFPYENDEVYKSLILSNKNMDDGIILYEKIINEGEYLRISEISEYKIKNILYNIDYYNYDKDGNIISNKKKKDSIIIKENYFTINNSIFEKQLKTNFKSWYGKYIFTINKESPEWRDIQDVILTIKEDSAIFHVEGYQIDQNYSLSYIQEENKLRLFYNKSLDNFESAILRKTKDFGILSYNGKNYIWSCPYIDDSFTNGKKLKYKLKKLNEKIK